MRQMRIKTTVSLVVLLVAIGAGVSAVSAQTAADLVERAAAASAEGRTDEALRDLNAAIRLEPKYAPAYARRGLLHAQAMLKEQRPGAYDPDTKIPRTDAASSALLDLD